MTIWTRIDLAVGLVMVSLVSIGERNREHDRFLGAYVLLFLIGLAATMMEPHGIGLDREDDLYYRE